MISHVEGRAGGRRVRTSEQVLERVQAPGVSKAQLSLAALIKMDILAALSYSHIFLNIGNYPKF